MPSLCFDCALIVSWTQRKYILLTISLIYLFHTPKCTPKCTTGKLIRDARSAKKKNVYQNKTFYNYEKLDQLDRRVILWYYRDFTYISCFVDLVFRHFPYFKFHEISYSCITWVEFLIFSKICQKCKAVEELWRTTFRDFLKYFSRKLMKNCVSR